MRSTLLLNSLTHMQVHTYPQFFVGMDALLQYMISVLRMYAVLVKSYLFSDLDLVCRTCLLIFLISGSYFPACRVALFLFHE